MDRTDKIKKMLDLQESINITVNPNWRNSRYAWPRAIWTECAELMDAVGFKWWKQSVPDTAKMHGELVDIFHFLLSYALENFPEANQDHCLANVIDEWMSKANLPFDPPSADYVREHTEALALIALFRPVCIDTMFAIFYSMSRSAELSIEGLYIKYIGKNVLNQFRQANGYNEGTYQKTWSDGREDNDHLNDILDTLDPDLPDFANSVFSALQERYTG